MPLKAHKMPKKGKGNNNDDEIKAEEKLQAIVCAQAFDLSEQFKPLSDDVPPALFPLANVALIDYTMELLVAAGVQELFVFCGGGDHGKQIRAHLRGSPW